MTDRICQDPQDVGRDLPVEGAVDTTGGVGTTPGSRPTSRHLFPTLIEGVELATGFFNRLESKYVGIKDGFRIGNLITSLPSSLVNLFSALLDSTEETSDLLTVIHSTLTTIKRDTGLLNADTYVAKQLAYALGLRKVVGVDGGAYVYPAVPSNVVTFTGVNLVGRVWFLYNPTDQTFYRIIAVVDPAGGAVGTLTLDKQIGTAGTILFIPYSAAPHAWNSAVDAIQSLAVAGDPPRINGPSTFLSVGAAVIGAGTTQYILPCANYGRYAISIVWTSASTTTLQFRSYGKHDDALWAAAGAIPATYCIDAKWEYSDTGAQFGIAPATTGVLVANMIAPKGYNSIAIEMIAAASAGFTPTTGTYTLYGGTK